MKINRKIKTFKINITHKDIEKLLDCKALIYKEINVDGFKYELKLKLDKA